MENDKSMNKDSAARAPTTGGIKGAFNNVASDIGEGMHKAAQTVGLEQKPASRIIKEDAENIVDSAKIQAKSIGHAPQNK